MNAYLDTDKSVLISSPAGSGKTEKLARRYISLLQKGIDVERILAITFTDKAAAEMKQRILKILRDDDRTLFNRLLEKMPLMRVSTIHSFCGTLLRRFSFEASVDPNYKIEDAIDSGMAWEEVLYDILIDAGRGNKGHELFLHTVSEKGFRGLDRLRNTVDYLYRNNPFSLKAGPFSYTPRTSSSAIDELKSWQGVKDVIDVYEDFLEKDDFAVLPDLEKYFLTGAKEPRKRPVPELKNIADYRGWAAKMRMCWKDRKVRESVERTERMLEIYRKCIRKYSDRKSARGLLDFSDLEYLTYRMITKDPEWANILYAFDEKTDHILVDEFQDTNTFQWEIINKLTEEWRSGLGAKREKGTRPTIFFVGDEKQSIYYFRGANVEIFSRAKEKLRDWLGEEFIYEEVKENYRSLPAIIEFINRVFSNIMQARQENFPWVTTYTPFNSYRTGESGSGRIEIIMLGDKADTTSDAKQREAEVLAQRIQGFAGNFQITDRVSRQQRTCKYMDMAILLRKRTHLKKYEEALRQYNIPFVAVKGIGFYQEPEVAMLRSLIFFLSNPRDDYSLYVLLKSPLFNIDEGDIIRLISSEGDCLYLKLQKYFIDKTGASRLHEPAMLLHDWLSQLPYTPISELIEYVLVSTKAWRYFHEAQTGANIRKFIRIIEDLEANGKSLLKIRDFLERTYGRSEEPKANVNTEGMDAVKIMTIHAAKGLEFPVVFIPGLEEPFTTKTGDSLVYEKDGKFFFKSEPEPSIRRQDEDFLIHLAKEEEEQKRLFYVAATRAEEALVLLSHWSGRDKNFLGFLRQGIGLEQKGPTYSTESEIQGLSILTAEDVKKIFEQTPRQKTAKTARRTIEVIPLSLRRQTLWRPVTETVDIRRRHGKDRLILGDILHRIFEGVSKGIIREQDILTRAEGMLESKGILREQREKMTAIVLRDIETLTEKGIWRDIILPVQDSFSELPFIFEEENVVYTGRIDRIIKDGNSYKIYDYKTFPVKEKEMEYFLREYSSQLNIYKMAVGNLFNTKNVGSFIIFTHTGDIRKV